MHQDLILILEDNGERIAGFEAAVERLGAGLTLRLWRDAHAFIAEAGPILHRAVLISLDHDLNRPTGAHRDPGDGLAVATWLAQRRPVCPVIVHSSNHERVESMINELRFGGWTWARVGPFGEHWIDRDWHSKALSFLSAFRALRATDTVEGR